MACIGVGKNTYDGLTANQKAVVNRVLTRLDFGTPALYQTAGAIQWYIFDDPRVDLLDLAILGVVAANLGSLPDVTGFTPAQIRNRIQTFIQGKIVLPSAINYTGSTNFWQTTLTANGAPASVQAADAVPAGWVAQ